MSCSATEIINVAKNEIGTIEKSTNNVKYNTDYYGGAVSGSQFDWCVVFIWWCFKKLNSTSIFCGGIKTAYVPYVDSYARKNGYTVSKSNMREGDILIYDWDGDGDGDHIGFCESVSGNTITAIEGNTSGTNGEGVYRKTRSKADVLTVYRPPYSSASSTNVSRETIYNVAETVIRGDYGNGNTRKKKLEAKGYNYSEVQDCVNAILADSGNTNAAEAVIRGEYGNGTSRKKNLETHGYNYNNVQTIVNAMLKEA